MFYSVFVLGKKGPLARVWLAAHWDKKITKAQILETNITESVDSILQPRVKLSLRTSSHLLLGIVRIYARKTMYLLQDCQDAAFKIKSAFRPGAVDLPADKTEAAISAITLPEMLDFINDFDLIAEPQLNVELPQTSANLRNITLVDEPSGINMEDSLLPGFRDWADMSSEPRVQSISLKDTSVNPLEVFNKEIPDDGFDPYMDEDIFPVQSEAAAPTDKEAGEQLEQPPSARPPSAMSAASSMSYGAPPSGPPSTPGTPHSPEHDRDDGAPFLGESVPEPTAETLEPSSALDKIRLPELDREDIPKRGGPRVRKKRGAIIIDDPKTLSGEEMKAQLSDTSDTVSTLDLAPPTKKMMNWKKTGGSEKLFSLPERIMFSETLQTYFSRHCYTRQIKDSEDFEPLEDHVPLVNGEVAHPSEDYEMLPPADLDLIPQTPGRPPQTPGRAPRRSPTKRKPRDKEATRKAHKEPRMDNHISMEEVEDTRRPPIEPQEEEEEDEFEDNYLPPDSVMPDESRREDESNEQYEERVRNIRTTALLRFMSTQLETFGQIIFREVVESNRKKQVAQKFFSILVLKKQQAIELNQQPSTPSIPYGDITITRGPRYEEVLSLLPHQY